jgi:hypothetical protein
MQQTLRPNADHTSRTGHQHGARASSTGVDLTMLQHATHITQPVLRKHDNHTHQLLQLYTATTQQATSMCCSYLLALTTCLPVAAASCHTTAEAFEIRPTNTST